MVKALTYIYGLYNNHKSRNSYIRMSKQAYAAVIISLSATFVFSTTSISFCQSAPQQEVSKIQKSLEDLESYGQLQKKIETGEKVHIKDITVKGVTAISQDEVKTVVDPYIDHWLTQSDIQQLIDSLEGLYNKKSLKLPQKAFYRIEGNKLIIEIKE